MLTFEEVEAAGEEEEEEEDGVVAVPGVATPVVVVAAVDVATTAAEEAEEEAGDLKVLVVVASMVLAEEDSLKDSAVDSLREVLVVVDVVVVDSEEVAAKVVDVVGVEDVEDAGREGGNEREKVGDHFRADLWRRPYSWPPFIIYNNIKSVVPKLLACQLFNQRFCFCYFDKLSNLLTR